MARGKCGSHSKEQVPRYFLEVESVPSKDRARDQLSRL
jgi:hypothetical protein